MVMVWWQGMQCETHREDLCGGEQGTKKNAFFEKTIYPAKNPEKKMKKVITMVSAEIDPSPLWRRI